MPSKRLQSSDAGPAPKKQRTVGHNSCQQCKKSKVLCRKLESGGKCERCAKRGSPCSQVMDDGRTNRAAVELLSEKMEYFSAVCRDYAYLLQAFSGTDLPLDVRHWAWVQLASRCPSFVAARLREIGYPEVPVGSRTLFMPAVSSAEPSTLSDRRRLERDFSSCAYTRITQLHNVLLLTAGPMITLNVRGYLYGPSRTGNGLRRAVVGLAGWLLPLIYEEQRCIDQYRVALEEPDLSKFREERARQGAVYRRLAGLDPISLAGRLAERLAAGLPGDGGWEWWNLTGSH